MSDYQVNLPTSQIPSGPHNAERAVYVGRGSFSRPSPEAAKELMDRLFKLGISDLNNSGGVSIKYKGNVCAVVGHEHDGSKLTIELSGGKTITVSPFNLEIEKV